MLSASIECFGLGNPHIVSEPTLLARVRSATHGFLTFGHTEKVEPNLKEGTLVRFLVTASAGSAATNRTALVPLVPHGPRMSVKKWRAHRKTLAAMAALFILAACAGRQQLTPSNCIAPPQSGFIGARNGEERMTVVQNGKACETFIMNNKGAVGVGKIVTPATHGAASLRFVYEATYISYTPARDYVGGDRFVVAFGPDSIETVEVEIVPSPTKP